MATKPKTIDDYIAALPAEAAAIATKVRQTIRDAAPEATEAISYGMPTFRLGGTYLIYFAAWKKHIGMYPIPGETPFEPEIAPYRAEKGSVHFSYAKPIPYALIGRIVRARVATVTQPL